MKKKKKQIIKWLYAIIGILGTYMLAEIISSCLPEPAQPVVWYVCGCLGMWIGMMQFIIEHLENEVIEVAEPLTPEQIMEIEQLKTHKNYVEKGDNNE